jgi:hypothetical protein
MEQCNDEAPCLSISGIDYTLYLIPSSENTAQFCLSKCLKYNFQLAGLAIG